MKITLVYLSALVLFSCNSATNKQPAPILQKDTLVEQADTTDKLSSDCARGIPEPVIEKEDYTNAVFTLANDSSTATETLKLSNGDRLTITHTGCEYYTLAFRFETGRYAADTADLKYWYATASKLLTPLISATQAPINIKRGVMFLGYETAKPETELYLNEEIDFGGEDIRESISLNRIEKLSNNKYAVEITFSIGPL